MVQEFIPKIEKLTSHTFIGRLGVFFLFEVFYIVWFSGIFTLCVPLPAFIDSGLKMMMMILLLLLLLLIIIIKKNCCYFCNFLLLLLLSACVERFSGLLLWGTRSKRS